MHCALRPLMDSSYGLVWICIQRVSSSTECEQRLRYRNSYAFASLFVACIQQRRPDFHILDSERSRDNMSIGGKRPNFSSAVDCRCLHFPVASNDQKLVREVGLIHRLNNRNRFLRWSLWFLHQKNCGQHQDDTKRLQWTHHFPERNCGDEDRKNRLQATDDDGAGGLQMLQSGEIKTKTAPAPKSKKKRRETTTGRRSSAPQRFSRASSRRSKKAMRCRSCKAEPSSGCTAPECYVRRYCKKQTRRTQATPE